MAAKPNIYALLKNVDAFVKAVPINPKAANYKKWLKNRAETRKAIREIVKLLRLLEMVEPKALTYPCRLILQKQVLERLLRCLKIPLKYAEAEYLRLCGVVLQKQVYSRFRDPER